MAVDFYDGIDPGQAPRGAANFYGGEMDGEGISCRTARRPRPGPAAPKVPVTPQGLHARRAVARGGWRPRQRVGIAPLVRMQQVSRVRARRLVDGGKFFPTGRIAASAAVQTLRVLIPVVVAAVAVAVAAVRRRRRRRLLTPRCSITRAAHY